MLVNCQTVLKQSYKLVIKSLGHSNKNFQGQKPANRRHDLARNVKEGKAVTKCCATGTVHVLRQEWEDVYLNHALKQFRIKDSPLSYEVWLSADKMHLFLRNVTKSEDRIIPLSLPNNLCISDTFHNTWVVQFFLAYSFPLPQPPSPKSLMISPSPCHKTN